MKAYKPAPKEVHDRITALIGKFHPELEMVGVKIDVLMASTDAEEGHAVTLGGYPCQAVIRVLDLKNRTMGRGDAEIVIDAENFENLDERQQDALLDHELYHIETKKTRYGKPKRDDVGRPCLGLRKHDHQFGWFDAIAERHGVNSFEVKQATAFRRNVGQLYLDLDISKPFGAITRDGGSVTILHPRTGEGVRISKEGIQPLNAA